MFKTVFLIFTIVSLGSCAQWVNWSSSRSDLPGGAFVGGRDRGYTYYVIRAWYNGMQLPGKYSDQQNYGYISYGGKEIPVRDFEILTIAYRDELTWENANSGRSFVPGGSSGVYICRFDVGPALVPGKLHNGQCHVPHGGRERSSNNWATLKFS